MNYSFSFLLSFVAISSLPAKESGSWLIFHNNIKILKGEDRPFSDNKYILNIDKKSLDSTGSLKVEYSDDQNTPKEEKWTRIIEIVDKHGNNVFRKENTDQMEIENSQLKKILGRRKKIIIQSFVTPPPGSNTKVKIRIIHLCTLRLL